MGSFSSNAVTGEDDAGLPLGAAKSFGLDSVELGVAAGLYSVGEHEQARAHPPAKENA